MHPSVFLICSFNKLSARLQRALFQLLTVLLSVAASNLNYFLNLSLHNRFYCEASLHSPIKGPLRFVQNLKFYRMVFGRILGVLCIYLFFTTYLLLTTTTVYFNTIYFSKI